MLERVKFVHVLTMTVIVVASAVMFAVIFMDSFEDGTMRAQVLTAATGVLTTAVGYWIGSSNSSDKKTDLLAQSQPVDPK